MASARWSDAPSTPSTVGYDVRVEQGELFESRAAGAPLI